MITRLLFTFTLLLPASLFAGQIHDAICNGDLNQVKRLLSNKAQINREQDGEYPLSLAAYCYGGQPQIAEYLLDRGADVNLAKKGDYPPVMWAIRSMGSGSTNPMRKVVFRMLRMGAKGNGSNPGTGQTALMWAASAGDSELVDLLLSKGADKSARTKPGWCDNAGTECRASDTARLGGHVELALKLEGKDPAPYRKTLHYAVKQGDMARVQSLIAGGVNVNEQEQLSNITALHYAVKLKRKEAIQKLLAARANPNLMNFAGITPLRDAVTGREDEMARMLIDGGAKANHEQTQGCGGGLTEFGWAIEYGQHALATYMIERRALDPADPGKAFQQLYGRHEGDVSVTRLLLDKGGQPVEADIEMLRKIETANPWLKEKGYTQRIIGMLEVALKQPSPQPGPSEPETESEVVVDDELPEPPELDEMAGLRARGGAPATYRSRSNQRPNARAQRFDQRFRNANGVLDTETLPGR